MNNNLILILSLSFLVISCKKEQLTSNSIVKTPNSENYFSLRKDGDQLVSYNPEYVPSSAGSSVNILQIAVYDQEYIYQLTIQKDIHPGVYKFNAPPNGFILNLPFILMLTTNSNQSSYFLKGGSVAIISNDTISKKIHFQFNLQLSTGLGDPSPKSIHLTEGDCSIDY